MNARYYGCLLGVFLASIFTANYAAAGGSTGVSYCPYGTDPQVFQACTATQQAKPQTGSNVQLPSSVEGVSAPLPSNIPPEVLNLKLVPPLQAVKSGS